MAMGRSYVAVIVPILVSLIVGGIDSSAQTTPKDCVNELMGLYPCLDFVTNDKIREVTPQCCSALDTTVKTNVLCLCMLFTNNSDSLGFPINQTRALLLPTLCKIAVPPVSACQYLAYAPSAPPNYSGPSPPVTKGSAHGLSPPNIDVPAPRSGTSKALGGVISFVPSITVTLFIWLGLISYS